MRPKAGNTRPTFTIAVVAALCAMLWRGAEAEAVCSPPPGTPQLVTAGKETYVCVIFNNRTFTAFTPTADQFSVLHITDSNTGVSAGTGFVKHGEGWVPASAKANDTAATYYVTVAAASGGLQSLIPKVFKALEPAQERTVPLMTAVVHVDQGVVTLITWDEGCLFCDENDASACMRNSFDADKSTTFASPDYSMCAQSKTQCDSSAGSCDLQLYVVWTGTDAEGNYLTSAGLRFSRYRSFGVESLYNSARVKASEGYASGSKVAGNVEKFVE